MAVESFLIRLERVLFAASTAKRSQGSTQHGSEGAVVSTASQPSLPALPGLILGGVPIGLPLNSESVEFIESFSAGLSANCASVAASQLVISNPGWDGVTIPAIVSQVRKALGIPAVMDVEATLVQLLVLGAAGDTSEYGLTSSGDASAVTGEFGVLEVVLPSAWDGGELLLRHGKRSWSFGYEPANMYAPQHICYFKEVSASIAAPTKGYRVSLLYRLTTRTLTASGTPVLRAPAPHGSNSSELAQVAVDWARATGAHVTGPLAPASNSGSASSSASASGVATGAPSAAPSASHANSLGVAASAASDGVPSRVGIILRHRYYGCGLSPDQLNGADAALVGWAREAARLAPGSFVPYLCLLQVREDGSCEEKSAGGSSGAGAGGGSRRHSRKRARYDDDDDEGDASGNDNEEEDEDEEGSESDDDCESDDGDEAYDHFSFSVEETCHVLTCWTRLTAGGDDDDEGREDDVADALPDELLLRSQTSSVYGGRISVDETGSIALLPRGALKGVTRGKSRNVLVQTHDYDRYKYGTTSGRFTRWFWRAVLVLDFRAAGSSTVHTLLVDGIAAAVKQLRAMASSAASQHAAELAAAKTAYDAAPRPWDLSSYPTQEAAEAAEAAAGSAASSDDNNDVGSDGAWTGSSGGGERSDYDSDSLGTDNSDGEVMRLDGDYDDDEDWDGDDGEKEGDDDAEDEEDGGGEENEEEDEEENDELDGGGGEQEGEGGKEGDAMDVEDEGG